MESSLVNLLNDQLNGSEVRLMVLVNTSDSLLEFVASKPFSGDQNLIKSEEADQELLLSLDEGKVSLSRVTVKYDPCTNFRQKYDDPPSIVETILNLVDRNLHHMVKLNHLSQKPPRHLIAKGNWAKL